MAKTKIKIIKQVEPIPANDSQAYWKGFAAGKDHERKVAIEYFITKMEQLKNVEGIGEVRFQKIMDFVNKEWG